MPFTYQYPHPAVTVDCIIFALHDDELKVLLIQRNADPHKGRTHKKGRGGRVKAAASRVG